MPQIDERGSTSIEGGIDVRVGRFGRINFNFSENGIEVNFENTTIHIIQKTNPNLHKLEGGFEIDSHAGGQISYPFRISLIPRSGQQHGCPWDQNRDIARLQRDRPIHVGHRGISQNSGVGRVASAERLPRLPVAARASA